MPGEEDLDGSDTARKALQFGGIHKELKALLYAQTCFQVGYATNEPTQVAVTCQHEASERLRQCFSQCLRRRRQLDQLENADKYDASRFGLNFVLIVLHGPGVLRIMCIRPVLTELKRYTRNLIMSAWLPERQLSTRLRKPAPCMECARCVEIKYS